MDKAEVDLNRYIQSKPESIEGYLANAELYRSKTEFQKALMYIDTALLLFHKRVDLDSTTRLEDIQDIDDVPLEDILYEKGMIEFSLGRYTEAVNSFTFCITKEFSLNDCYYFRALSYRKMGLENLAVADLNHTTYEFDPDDYNQSEM